MGLLSLFQCSKGTGRTMFHIMSFVFFCSFLVPLASPQTYFHTSHGSGASFTSVSHGHASTSIHQVAAQTATYHQPEQRTAYKAPSLKPFVHQQSHAKYQRALASHATYQPAHPAPPVPQGPGVTDYSEKCGVDYVEQPAKVCLPKLDSNCEQKDTTIGLVILQKQECQTITRTICTENVEVAENEICAYSFH